jgi:pimeloyl-ACP methyl ester carboxylesterase
MREQGVPKTSPAIGKFRRGEAGSNIHRLEFKRGFQHWAFRPEREDLAVEFARLLGAAEVGGSTVAECVATARAIDFSDDNSWYREWKKTADSSYAHATAALGSGNGLTAQSTWLRAMNYYQAAAFPFDSAEENYRTAIAGMRRCARDYVRHRTPRGEVVQIPWLSDYPLEGYFLSAAQAPVRAPVVICVAEPGQRKEEYLYKAVRYASDRGMSLLVVDLFGAAVDTRFDEVVGRRDLEAAIGHIMDYLLERDDVDERRIAILTDRWISSFVARGIAFDDRFAAAVCDGGLWDLHERDFLRDRIARDDGNLVVGPIVSRVARNIKCPVLIAAGESGGLEPDRVRQLYERLRASGGDVTLKIFANEETAAAHGHADNPTLANEFIFDWIASRLAVTPH